MGNLIHRKPRGRKDVLAANKRSNDNNNNRRNDDRRPSIATTRGRENSRRGGLLRTDTLRGVNSFFTAQDQCQYTIVPKTKRRFTNTNNRFLRWFDNHHMHIAEYACCHQNEVDMNVYKPSMLLYRYINWTFKSSFTSVFMSFLIIYFCCALLFAALILVAGTYEPECIQMAGESYGTTPLTKFSDAFALSWTTFATVGYGMTYTSVGSQLRDTPPNECVWTVTFCTTQAFMGLLFAGLSAAILFGKVNRVQSHANIMFANAVCLQYEETFPVDDDDDDDEDDDDDNDDNDEEEEDDDDDVGRETPFRPPIMEFSERTTERAGNLSRPSNRELSDRTTERAGNLNPEKKEAETATFVDKYNGCPVIKFQIVNEWSNCEGGEIVDCQMKVVGVKYRKDPINGKVTHSQYVRVNLVNYEHPFLSRVWHGVHILDSSSPLLTDMARQRIEVNGGSWPSQWFDPDIIRSKLDFHNLIVTVIGLSNVSAMAVHAYKRYKIGDVLIGFNFAPIVFRDIETGLVEVDFDMANDVREQLGLRCENLSMRRIESKENVLQNPLAHRTQKLSSSTTIRWERSRMLSIGGSTPFGRGSSFFFGQSAVSSEQAEPRDETLYTTICDRSVIEVDIRA